MRCIINTLYFIYRHKGSKDAIDFLNNWYTTDKQSRTSLVEKEQLPEDFDVTETIAVENKKLFETLKVSGTPTIFVNGFKYPEQYEYKEMEYYMDELKKLNTESKRQEACANCH